MSRRNLSQPSLADALVNDHSRGNAFLEEVKKLIGWSAFAVLFKDIHGNALGAPGYLPIAMFKIALLQQWYGLSDPAAEEAVADRLSFRRFCGFPLDQKTPDHMSIWRFRQRLVDLGLQDQLLAELNRQVGGRGLLVKRGTLVAIRWFSHDRLPADVSAEVRFTSHPPCRALQVVDPWRAIGTENY